MAPRLTIAGSYLRHIASFLDPAGVEPWLAFYGLSAPALTEATLDIGVEDFAGLLLSASERAGEPALGLFLGQRLVAQTHGFVGYAALNSRSLREVLAVLERFVSLRLSILRIKIERVGGEIHLKVLPVVALGELARPLMEAVLLSVRNVLDAVSLGTFQVRAISFPFAAPSYAELARSVAATHVRYDQPWAGLTLDANALDLPLRTADLSVFVEAEQICQRRLEELEAGQSLGSRVRRLLLERGGGFPSMHEVAHRLRMTPRTLHRRLGAEETSFRALLDDVRFRLAQDYLDAGSASLDEIAFILGYSDPANFRRAFRRWAGVSPSAYRRGLGLSTGTA